MNSLLILSITSLLILICHGYNPYSQPQTYRAKANKKLVKYIIGQVCEESMKQLVREVNALRKERENRKNKNIEEEEIFELADDICNPYTNAGIWSTQFDLVNDAKNGKVKLERVTDEDIGECGVECETIGYACQQIMDDNNIDIVEMLYAGKKRSHITNQVCLKGKKYVKKEKKFKQSNKNKELLSESWFPCDDERRKLIILQDVMPNDVQMFDPTMMSMEEMTERMKYSQGEDMDMPGMGGMGDMGMGGMGGLGGMGGMGGMPDMSELFGDMSEEEIEELMKMYQESGMDGMGMDGMGMPGMEDMMEGMSGLNDGPNGGGENKKAEKKPKKTYKDPNDVGLGDVVSDAWDSAKEWAGGMFGSGTGSDKYETPKSDL